MTRPWFATRDRSRSEPLNDLTTKNAKVTKKCRGDRRSPLVPKDFMDFPINPPIGERVRRKETQRFITGTGRYVDDLLPSGTLHVSFVRSSCAHARIKSIGVE